MAFSYSLESSFWGNTFLSCGAILLQLPYMAFWEFPWISIMWSSFVLIEYISTASRETNYVPLYYYLY
jgi:hypothetical protein